MTDKMSDNTNVITLNSTKKHHEKGAKIKLK